MANLEKDMKEDKKKKLHNTCVINTMIASYQKLSTYLALRNVVFFFLISVLLLGTPTETLYISRAKTSGST